MKTPDSPIFSILLVDDEPAWLRSLSRTLQSLGGYNNLLKCSDSREVLSLLEQHDIGVILLDLTMPHCSGEEILHQINDNYPEVPVVIISGLNQLETAVRCMRQGAYDYFVKTDEEERLLDGVRRAVQMAALKRENANLHRNFLSNKLNQPDCFAHLVTRSTAMLTVFRYLEAVASSSQPLLILGESGVGKELIAQAVHNLCQATGDLVAVNVAGLDDNTFADTLFGHKRGAFTGAEHERGGMIEKAAHGTLLLDEIGDLSHACQIKLLRLLQEAEYYPLGSDSPQQVKARIIFATHQNLEEKVANGDFRRDLYFRISAHQVKIPPLRQRREDIPLLIDHFLVQAAKDQSKPKPTPPPQLATLLASYCFPGNIRELRGMIFNAVSLHNGGVLSMASFNDRITPSQQSFLTKPSENPFLCMEELPTLNEASELLVTAALERVEGNQTQAARLLGIAQPSLSKRLKRRKHAEKEKP